ncbi:MAG: hypothetical protein WDN28_06155 [Chthoniobacter sp.]
MSGVKDSLKIQPMRHFKTMAIVATVVFLAEAAFGSGLTSDLLYRRLPSAKAVPGRPGLVFCPFGKSKGLIDVRGIPPETEVKDPYTGKSFLVPKP